MKNYDCHQCKNKQAIMHCLYYQFEPDIEFCSGFQKEVKLDPNNDDEINRLIRRRAIDLVNNYSGVVPLMTMTYWSHVIKQALSHHTDKDFGFLSRFIRYFGHNGLSFGCNSCGEIVELEDDSDLLCPSCHDSDFYLQV